MAAPPRGVPAQPRQEGRHDLVPVAQDDPYNKNRAQQITDVLEAVRRAVEAPRLPGLLGADAPRQGPLGHGHVEERAVRVDELEEEDLGNELIFKIRLGPVVLDPSHARREGHEERVRPLDE